MFVERTTDPAPVPIVVDAGLIRKTIEVLRASAERRRCWWCARPLENGLCAVCDRDGSAWS